ncbi:Serine/arginine-rich splicing factor like [Quillaja saponaria]|uniref:Serine/arginine-rich splicing factor like n=1 Tax=Quillaja saponaria TaxID=32244 RepID=A0AAD7PYP3_QUISA|nr:Serine/arginine-rich splicing factor like [Quillaja saponaria]
MVPVEASLSRASQYRILMSLYIGNLSTRTRIDELEHAFLRFGRCNVHLKKDGYGFVVYDFPPNADKALRALQGRSVCGEPLTLTWSNKQPRRFQGLSRGRNSEIIGSARKKVNYNGWRNDRMGIRQRESGDRRGKSVVMQNDEIEYDQNDFKDHVGEERQDYREGLPDEGGRAAPNLVDTGRWGEQVCDPLVEHATELDSYKSYHGYVRKDGDENHHSAPQSSQNNLGRAHIGDAALNKHNDLKAQKSCYRCGDPGHKMRNCPKESTSQRMSNRLHSRLDNDIEKRHRDEEEQERYGSSSWEKLWSSRDNLSMSQQRNDRGVSSSRNHQIVDDADWPHRKDYGRNKQIRNKTGTPKEHNAKKARTFASSAHSDYSESRYRSITQSSKHMLRSISHSGPRSVTSRSRSLSSDLRSSSKSYNSRSISQKSRKSSFPTSLSVSPSRALPSSSKKVQLNMKGSLENTATLDYMEHQIEHGQQIEGNVALENDKPQDKNLSVNNGNVGLYTKVVDDIEKDQHLHEDNNEKPKLSKPSVEATNASKPVSDRSIITAESLSPEIVRETEDVLGSGAPTVEHMPTLNKAASETQVNLRSGHSTNISSEEMSKVLKLYGLELPEEDEQNLTVDTYFGSARLWPWEIIYYRRLKKGPISTENYARRVAQNQEFSIVDKYIRSSTGWGELGSENPC